MPLQPSPSVARAAKLLEHLARRPTQPMSASELARVADIPRATCSSLLMALAEHGLVSRDEGRRYGLGPACIALGDAARAANPSLRAARTHAEALARALGGVTAVSLRDGDQTRVANVFDFGPAFGLRPRAGDAIGLVPPFGATFVAWDHPDAVQRWLDRTVPPLTADEVDRYRAALAAVRHRGYSITVASDRQARLAKALEDLAEEPDEAARRRRDHAMEEIAHGDYLTAEIGSGTRARLTQISAPVFEPGGGVTVSIMLLGPGPELAAEQINELGERVRAAAAAATIDVGGREPQRP